jgi:hypothetical protein
MASTTEELTGQADQLVSALSFFQTGDEEGGRPRKAGSVKVARPAAGAPMKAVKPAHRQGTETKPAAHGGVSLRLNDKHNDLDGEFERY